MPRLDLRTTIDPAAEHGSALLVALVMILVLSLLGVASMRGATLEGRLANNSLAKEITFQAAESSTDLVLAKPNVLENVICQPDREDTVDEVNAVAEQVTTTVLSDGGQTNPVDYSLGGPISARRFVIVGTSALPGASTETAIAQGVVLIGAHDPTGGCA